MKAIIYETYGSLDVLLLNEVAKPTPKDDGMLVKVQAAVNSLGWHLMRGEPFLACLENRLQNRLQNPKLRN